ncbi:MAG: hypothetical protein RR247_02655 [Clostridia bacterium]
MAFGETKVYFDGSHYIAIPHTTRPNFRKPKSLEEKITIVEKSEDSTLTENVCVPSLVSDNGEKTTSENENKIDKNKDNFNENTNNQEKRDKVIKKLTKKEYFNELYLKYINLKKREIKSKIIEDMISYFSDMWHCEMFVDNNIERKQRNLICRRIRMCRKANLANFNYFCTFTYDDKLHTETTFKKKLKACFRNMCYRKDWKYMGVWERAPKTNRLHFHGLFAIPENKMSGDIIEVRDYSTQLNKMQKTFQSTYFNEKFGRSDFKEIDENERRLGNALAYLMKYIEKTGEKIVYSKGLPQFFISDILDDDIVCPIGQEDKKLLLFDDFMCLDEGCFVGKVSPEVIKQMRKSN